MISLHPGRVIIRANSIFLDSNNDIIKEWVELCGAPYDDDDNKRDWHTKNLVRLAGIDEHRMHFVIDMGLNDINPHDSACIPLTVYRYNKDSKGKGYDFPALS